MSKARIVKAIGRSLKRAPKKKRVPKMSKKKHMRVAQNTDLERSLGRKGAKRVRANTAMGAAGMRNAGGGSYIPRPKHGSVEKMQQDIAYAIRSGFDRVRQQQLFNRTGYYSLAERTQRGAKAYANRRVRKMMGRDSAYRRRGSSDAHVKSRLMPPQVQHLDHVNSPSTYTRAYNMAMKNPRFFREPLPRPRPPRRRGRR